MTFFGFDNFGYFRLLSVFIYLGNTCATNIIKDYLKGIKGITNFFSHFD